MTGCTDRASRAGGATPSSAAAPLVDDAETWAALKRALHSGEVRIEEQGSEHMVVGSLQPEPSPLDTKLRLIGAPELYLALFEADEEFVDLFKVKVELDDTLERSPAHERALARFIAAAGRELGVPGLQAGAVAALIDHASREAGHQRRLSARLGRLRDRRAARDSNDARDRCTPALAATGAKRVGGHPRSGQTPDIIVIPDHVEVCCPGATLGRGDRDAPDRSPGSSRRPVGYSS